MTSKLCPMINNTCKEQCAWFIDDACAVTHLGRMAASTQKIYSQMMPIIESDALANMTNLFNTQMTEMMAEQTALDKEDTSFDQQE